MKKQDIIHVLEQQLRAAQGERRAGKRDPVAHAARIALKQYQSRRLAHTHADLLAASDTRAAALFFFNELYGARDLSQRDMDLERIIPTLQRVLTVDALKTITDAVVLDALSEKLDSAMAARLGRSFNDAQYAAAFAAPDEWAERERQAALVQQVGDALCKLVRIHFFLTTMLRVMRKPAHMAGLGDLQHFLEQGFNTFKAMRAPRQFVATVVRRERQLMENLYAGRPQPFEVD